MSEKSKKKNLNVVAKDKAVTDQITTTGRKISILDEVAKLWHEGKFESALAKLRSMYLQAPDDPIIAFEMGHILGELSFIADATLKQSLRDESVLILTKLCNNLEGIDSIDQWKFRRHLYLYSNQHERNIALGHEEIARGNALGVLSVGFGCLHHALELIEKNKFAEALVYAQRGSEAFQTLLSIDPPKPGRYLALALTLAILGHKKEALDATCLAAELLHRNAEDLKDHNEEMKRLLNFAERETR